MSLIRAARRRERDRDIDDAAECDLALRNIGKNRIAAGDIRGQALVTTAKAAVGDLVEHLEKKR